jgi:hypothetical protein
MHCVNYGMTLDCMWGQATWKLFGKADAGCSPGGHEGVCGTRRTVRCIISRNVHSSVCELFGPMEAQEPVFPTRAHALPFATTAVAHELHKLEPHSLECNFALLSFVAEARFFGRNWRRYGATGISVSI